MALNRKPRDTMGCGFRLSMLVMMNHNLQLYYTTDAKFSLRSSDEPEIWNPQIKYPINIIANI